MSEIITILLITYYAITAVITMYFWISGDLKKQGYMTVRSFVAAILSAMTVGWLLIPIFLIVMFIEAEFWKKRIF